MENTTIYKNLEPQDIRSIQRIKKVPLFEVRTGVYSGFNDIYDGWDGYTVDDIGGSTPVVKHLKRKGTEDVYFSFSRLTAIEFEDVKNDINEDISNEMITWHDALLYHKLVHMTGLGNEDGKYVVNDGTTTYVVDWNDKMDIIAFSRNYYKDAIDRNFFSMTLESEDVLFPSSKVRSSNIGRRVYLYVSTDDGGYDGDTDELVMKTDEDLDLTKPVGEVFLDAGIVILFHNQLEESDYGSDVLSYLTALGGNSLLDLTSTIYSLIMFNDEFNFSLNPTYYEGNNLDNPIKAVFRENPLTFPTTVGLYNDEGNLIATGRFSRTFEKSIEKAITIRAEISQ